MKRLILRNLRQRKVQVASIALSIAMCVMAFVALFLLYGGLNRGIELSEERSGAQLLVIPDSAETLLEESDFLFTGAPVGAYIPASLADDISQVEGVLRVTTQFYGQTISESCCTTSGATRIIGFDPATDWVILPYCSEDVSGGLAENEVIVGCDNTDFADGSGKILGNEVRVASRLEPTGTYLDNAVLMSMDAVRAMSGAAEQLSHYWDKYGRPDEVASAILVETADGDQDAVAGKIKRKVEGDYTVVVRSEVIAEAQDTLSLSFAVMLAAALVLAAASLLQLVSRFYALVWERKTELALYRALGARVRDLRLIIGGEALAITGAGLVVGTLLGVGAYSLLLGFLSERMSFPFQALDFGTALAGVLATAVLLLALTALAVVAPLRQVARIDPASAMQQMDIG